MKEITSRQNPRVKACARLAKRSERDSTGLTLVEGYRQLLRAVESGTPITELFACRELWLGANENALLERAEAAGAEVLETTPEVFAKLSMRDRPDGLLGVARVTLPTLDELWQRRGEDRPPLYLVVEGIEKPGNLGAILRSCDGAGASGVVVCDRVTDVTNPNVVRSSIGTLFTIPVAQAGSAETREWLARHDMKMVAATPAASAIYTESDLRGPVAIICGSEQYGLTPGWLEAPGIEGVRIPMRGTADSLNVAQACTLLVYEALRQRAVPFV